MQSLTGHVWSGDWWCVSLNCSVFNLDFFFFFFCLLQGVSPLSMPASVCLAESPNFQNPTHFQGRYHTWHCFDFWMQHLNRAQSCAGPSLNIDKMLCHLTRLFHAAFTLYSKPCSIPFFPPHTLPSSTEIAYSRFKACKLFCSCSYLFSHISF